METAARLAPVDGAAHPDDDYEHANAAYGALVMDQAWSALRNG